MRRSLKIAYAALVYLFLYLPLVVMVVYSFNAS
ncbi:MAG: spermidine/putrescine ABC transporter permease PotC, partial [Desulfobacterales bacterium]|nr:spermidine/putrescine ABC transporter permease PotC [Desulfobacterales bacterium]